MPSSTKKPMPFFPLYDRFLRDSKTGRRLQPSGKRISPGTIKNYFSTRTLLEKFCAIKKFELRVVNVNFLTQRKMEVEKNYWSKFYKKFTDFLYKDCGHFDNYVGGNIKIIKSFFSYLNKHLFFNVGEFYKQFYVRKEEVPIIALLPEELHFFIYDEAFTSRLSPQLRKVKDFFVFGCTVALRFSDLLRLNESNIRVIGDRWYLSIKSKKTDQETRIRLPEYAINIINKYKTQKGAFLLPRYNIVNLNLYLKKLVEQAGFNASCKKIRSKRGECKEIPIKNKDCRFCDLVTTHTMRRTAITTMLCLGMPEHTVRRISGHSPMSKEFFRYVFLAQSYQDEETEMVFNKLKDRMLKR